MKGFNEFFRLGFKPIHFRQKIMLGYTKQVPFKTNQYSVALGNFRNFNANTIKIPFKNSSSYFINSEDV